MAYSTITLTTAVSTAPGASTAVALNWIGPYQPVSVSLYGTSSTSSGAVSLQYTLDDIMRSTNPYWSGVSSAIGQPAQVFNSTTSFPDGVLVSFTSPVAAVRMTSSALNGGSWTMKVLQGG